jgi:tetratricopeptide (TPR) repeat protein
VNQESRKERALRKAIAFAQGMDKGLWEQERQRVNRVVRVDVEKSGTMADAIIETGNPKPEEWSFRFSLPAPMPEGATPTSDEKAKKLLLERVNKTQSEFQEAVLSLARFYSRVGKQGVAVSYIQQLIASTDCPESKAFFYLTLGQLMEQLQDFEKAVKFYSQALHLEPVSTQTWYFINNNLGSCLNHFGRFKEAERYCRAAMEIDPNRSNAYKNLGVSLQGRGQLAEATKYFISAVRTNSTDPRALKHLEELVAAHPTLSTEVPDFDRRLQNCRDAVRVASEYRQKRLSEHGDP